MASIYDSKNLNEDPDKRKQKELKVQRRVVFGITPSEEDRFFDSNVGMQLSAAVKRKLEEVVDHSNMSINKKR